MKEQVIAIPSRGRPEIIEKRTLKLIKGTENVYIFVEEQDYDNYKHLKKYGKIEKLPESNRGLTYARWYIQHYFKGIVRYVWQLDDNLDQFVVRKGLTDGGNPRLRPIEEHNIPAQEIFDKVLEIMKEKKYIQMTLSFRPTNWVHLPLIKEITRSWGIVLNDNERMLKNDIIYDLECKLFQDLDIVAQILSKGFMNACYYEYAFHKKMDHYKSGCSDYRTPKLATEVCHYLCEKFGENVRMRMNKKRNMNEPSFMWKNLFNTNKKKKTKSLLDYV